MAVDDELAAGFQAHREHLQRVAYAILGSVTEAEDAVQEAWLRLQRQPDATAVRDLRAWLTTAVSRLALDTLNSARIRREQYVGPWLPEPWVCELGDDEPAERVTLAESISLALLIVLEQLTPAERTAFLLHDVFGFSFREAGEIVGCSAAASRQLAARARQRVAESQPRFHPTRQQQLEIATAFARACTEGDLEQLISLLHPDAVWRSDGGGRITASRRPQHGAAKIARGMIAFARRPPQAGRLADVNGSPGLLLRDADGILTVIGLTTDDRQITAIDVIRNPDKLHALPPL